ncbi:S8 family serine peptidase [Rhizobium leguminosarum bv. viciae]|uniref:S8 family serine peptidase n=1 Tax=Rhizobium leguminosarum TaxID=384 RepID=UPI0014414A0A|nr:S8 family serine peptidase [Rhizobium leguminosarum]NKK01229.1 S8 family serine peptidase [Rhizobium leguminosarum bv. viciae]
MTVIDPRLQWLFDDTPPGTRSAKTVSVLFEWSGDVDILVKFGMVVLTTTGGIVSAQMPLSKLPFIDKLGIEAIEMTGRIFPTLDVSRADISADKVPPLTGNEPGKGVIIGIIDTGIDYRHASFRKANGQTRILYLWDQRLTLVPSRRGKQPRFPSETLPFDGAKPSFQTGVEFNGKAINDALSKGPQLRTQDTPQGHGSHVMGIAAGNGLPTPGAAASAYVGIAPSADLIVVATDFAHRGLELILQGIEYILARAEECNCPCVINLSLGTSSGARDGKSLTEKAIDAHLTTAGRSIVVAAGNAADDKAHAQGKVAQGATQSFGFTTDQKETADYLVIEVWYGLTKNSERFDIDLIAPGGEKASLKAPATGASQSGAVALGKNSVRIVSEVAMPNTGKNRVLIRVEKGGPRYQLAAGNWVISLRGKVVAAGANDGIFHAYLEAPKRKGGPLTVFSAPSPASTVCIPATASKVVSVGSYITKPASGLHKLSAFSSLGPALDGRPLPTLCAPGQMITSVRAANMQSDQGKPFTAMQGTSMAAPHVAGTIACLLQVEPTLTQDQISNILKRTADPPAAAAPNSWGSGRVNALKAVTDANALIAEISAFEELS